MVVLVGKTASGKTAIVNEMMKRGFKKNCNNNYQTETKERN